MVAVDTPERSEAMRRELALPFPILCDTERRVIKDWDIFNSRERGGIAKPSVYVIDRVRRVLYSSVDSVASRVPAEVILRVLKTNAYPASIGRKLLIPRLADWLRGIRENFR